MGRHGESLVCKGHLDLSEVKATNICDTIDRDNDFDPDYFTWTYLGLHSTTVDSEDEVSDRQRRDNEGTFIHFWGLDFETKSKFKKIKKVELLFQRIETIKTTRQTWLDRVFLKCSGCQSRLNASFIGGDSCPLCREKLTHTAKNQEKRDSYNLKIKQVESKINDLRKQFTKEHKVPLTLIQITSGHC